MARVVLAGAVAVMAGLALVTIVGVSISRGDAQATELDVVLEEFTITGDLATAPGPLAINITNAGAIAHNLVIEGTRVRSADLAPGMTEALTVDRMAAGTYRVVCDLPGHTEAGMVNVLAVGAGDEQAAVPAGDHDEEALAHDDADADDHHDDAMAHDDDGAMAHDDDDAMAHDDDGAMAHDDDGAMAHDDDNAADHSQDGTQDLQLDLDVDLVLEVEMIDFGYSPMDLEIPAGSKVRFDMVNLGQVEHEAIFADVHVQEEQAAASGDGGHDHHGDIPTLVLGPGESGSIVVEFVEAGATMIGCHIPGHWDAGMQAHITVT